MEEDRGKRRSKTEQKEKSTERREQAKYHKGEAERKAGQRKDGTADEESLYHGVSGVGVRWGAGHTLFGASEMLSTALSDATSTPAPQHRL